jgi:hypothetical protein
LGFFFVAVFLFERTNGEAVLPGGWCGHHGAKGPNTSAAEVAHVETRVWSPFIVRGSWIISRKGYIKESVEIRTLDVISCSCSALPAVSAMSTAPPFVSLGSTLLRICCPSRQDGSIVSCICPSTLVTLSRYTES